YPAETTAARSRRDCPDRRRLLRHAQAGRLDLHAGDAGAGGCAVHREPQCVAPGDEGDAFQPARQGRHGAKAGGQDFGTWTPGPGAESARREESRRDPLLEPSGGGRPQRQERSRPLATASRKVAVFTDGVRHLSRYTRITSATSVSQTPALVFVNRK